MTEAKQQPKRITAQPIRPAGSGKTTNRQLWATVCYHYPQYTLEQASQLTMRDIRLLINTAKRLQARQLFYMTQIVAAPHTEKGKGVKELTNFLSNEMEE